MTKQISIEKFINNVDTYHYGYTYIPAIHKEVTITNDGQAQITTPIVKSYYQYEKKSQSQQVVTLTTRNVYEGIVSVTLSEIKINGSLYGETGERFCEDVSFVIDGQESYELPIIINQSNLSSKLGYRIMDVGYKISIVSQYLTVENYEVSVQRADEIIPWGYSITLDNQRIVYVEASSDTSVTAQKDAKAMVQYLLKQPEYESRKEEDFITATHYCGNIRTTFIGNKVHSIDNYQEKEAIVDTYITLSCINPQDGTEYSGNLFIYYSDGFTFNNKRFYLNPVEDEKGNLKNQALILQWDGTQEDFARIKQELNNVLSGKFWYCRGYLHYDIANGANSLMYSETTDAFSDSTSEYGAAGGTWSITTKIKENSVKVYLGDTFIESWDELLKQTPPTIVIDYILDEYKLNADTLITVETNNEALLAESLFEEEPKPKKKRKPKKDVV